MRNRSLPFLATRALPPAAPAARLVPVDELRWHDIIHLDDDVAASVAEAVEVPLINDVVEEVFELVLDELVEDAFGLIGRDFDIRHQNSSHRDSRWLRHAEAASPYC